MFTITVLAVYLVWGARWFVRHEIDSNGDDLGALLKFGLLFASLLWPLFTAYALLRAAVARTKSG